MAGARSWLISVNIGVGWQRHGWQYRGLLACHAYVIYARARHGRQILSWPAEHPGFSQEVTLRLDGTGTWDGAEQRRECTARSAGVGSPRVVRRCPDRGRGNARPGLQRITGSVPERTLRGRWHG